MTPVPDEQNSRSKIIRGPTGLTGSNIASNIPTASSSMNKQAALSDAERKERERRKNREIADRVTKFSKDLAERKDEIFTNAMAPLTAQSRILFAHPAASPAYAMRLYPLTLERAAMLDALDVGEQYALEMLRASWDEEEQKIEEEWKQGKLKVRERCLEAIEERRKRAREEKDGEGFVGADNGPESLLASRLRPPEVPNSVMFNLIPMNGSYGTGVDDIVSPYPLSLTSTISTSANSTTNGRRRPNRGGARDGAGLVLGRAALSLTGLREGETESDLGDIRKGVKRRRAAAKSSGG
jgi:hypothetical protein